MGKFARSARPLSGFTYHRMCRFLLIQPCRAKAWKNKSTRQYYGKFYSMENFIPKHFGQVKTIKQQNHVIIDWLIFDI
jgi:hypothetical protein